MVLIATLAITAAQSPPPAIAELAPQAVQQIKDAPQEQSSALGSAEGGGAGDETIGTSTTTSLPAGVAPSTTTTVPPIERARVRRCVGDPPRQTEDPQSPPCVPYFEGDNGGATYKGVTRDTITIAIPNNRVRMIAALEAYFNKRYEFYGRRLKLVQGGGGENCTERKASAVQVDEQLKAFGALSATNGNAGPCFQAEMARRKLISAVETVTFAEADLANLNPYLWQYAMTWDKLLTGVGEMYCARLAGENAVRSSDPLIQRKPRKLGAIVQNVLRDTDLPMEPLERALAKCGETVLVERISTNDDVGLVSPERAQAAMLRMKTNDVTTVINFGILFVSQNMSSAADAQQYYPEWIFTSYGGFDANLGIKAFWPQASQRLSIFGVTINPLQRPWAQEPGFWAFQEVDPAIDPIADVSEVQDFVSQYRALLVVASGIQLAGPNLTPETFGAALQRTRFPYPADDPTRSGDVGFANDHSMTQGFTEFWWSEAGRSPVGYVSDGSTGAICYIDGGARRQLGQWPKGPGSFFELPCDSGA
jgi:hypothetical protein